ncbi:similar to Saccharomyces cerevisiae YFL021W GAT1 Transcriptional activator of genes involved in nitrogen catabolite repression [Maudiozyma saulgeensis]|uniref:Similar to Saccharomyces cerevisiae YFL021W GAT1 Transcriptional activator of genes involved in nitrogen catabolite repression n=1 Tax=Maudiozyma saulgeensis TaxID=1789683 RepID=A0A1X7QYP0_9SACH|nr:similar to Saccharomyces cerevisiae YFL021W GAT1 Transcriptional activator of genes involved in nitrogen catabolite repression [Kazachstania saulgeensis]
MSLLTSQFKELESINSSTVDSATRTNTNQDIFMMMDSPINHNNNNNPLKSNFNKNDNLFNESISIFKLYNLTKLNLPYKERIINMTIRLQKKLYLENENILQLLKYIDTNNNNDEFLHNEHVPFSSSHHNQNLLLSEDDEDEDIYPDASDTPYGSFTNDYDLNTTTQNLITSNNNFVMPRPIPSNSFNNNEFISFNKMNNNTNTSNLINMNFSLMNDDLDSFQNNSSTSLSQFHYLDDNNSNQLDINNSNWGEISNSLPNFATPLQFQNNNNNSSSNSNNLNSTMTPQQMITPSRTPSYPSIPLVSTAIISKRQQPKKIRRKNSNCGNSPDNKTTKCNNCQTFTTPLWRKDSQGNSLCNACGLFLKLHGVMRPLSLKTDVIKKRQRNGSTKRTNQNSQQLLQQPQVKNDHENLEWLSIKL